MVLSVPFPLLPLTLCHLIGKGSIVIDNSLINGWIHDIIKNLSTNEPSSALASRPISPERRIAQVRNRTKYSHSF